MMIFPSFSASAMTEGEVAGKGAAVATAARKQRTRTNRRMVGMGSLVSVMSSFLVRGARGRVAITDADAQREPILISRDGRSIVGAHHACQSPVGRRGVAIRRIHLDDLSQRIVGPQHEEVGVLAGAVRLLVEVVGDHEGPFAGR